MVSIALFVLLLATYAYSVPVGMNDNIVKQNNISQPITMHLIDDGESTPFPTSGQVTLTTGKDGLQMTTQRSFVNNARAPREMMQDAQVELSARGMELADPALEMNVRKVELTNPTAELAGRVFKLADAELEMNIRGVKESSTSFPTTVETSSQSGFGPRGVEQLTTLFPAAVETSSQFNQRRIHGQNVQLGKDLQTTEEPTSSVSSFATTTGLLRPLRGEEQESSSMSMDETTTEFSSTERSNTVIEIIPGRNTKTEIIPGRNTKTEIIPGSNTKTEIIPGSNTKTEIITNNSGRLVGGNRELSQGKN